MNTPDRRLVFRILLGLWIFLPAAGFVCAERLPVKTYTIADGLPMDSIAVIRKDSGHRLWFGTGEGVAWFDGHRFTSYTTEDGLPHRYVCDILEDRDGAIWVGTGDGLCLFRHSAADLAAHRGRPHFEVYRPKGFDPAGFWVNRLLDAGDGSIWCGSDAGLYRYRKVTGRVDFQPVDIGLKRGGGYDRNVSDILPGRDGGLWIATFQGLFHRRRDGTITHFGRESRIEDPYLLCLAGTSDGRIWIGSHNGLYCLTPPVKPGVLPSVRLFTEKDGLPEKRVSTLMAASDGRLWIGTRNGIAVMDRRTDETYDIRCYSTSAGVNDPDIGGFAEDVEDNLWVGTGRGALKISRHGFASYEEADGLPSGRINALFLDQTGRIGVQVYNKKLSYVTFDGRMFRRVTLPETESPDWVGPQNVFQDHLGAWWIAVTHKGLFRYPPSASFAGLDGQRPERIYTRRDGMPGDMVYVAFEDSRGDVWISVRDGYPHLGRWNRASGHFDRWDTRALPTAFGEDPFGNVWIGTLNRGVWRYRQGVMTRFDKADGFPPGYIMSIYSDRRGRLWFSTTQSGLVCVSEPDARQPRFQRLSVRDGLCSNQTRFVIEDASGTMFVGTARGLDMIDPATGGVRHFTTADGLIGNLQNVVLRDRAGSLWFGTWHGLSSLMHQPRRLHSPPSIVIRSLRLGGIPWPIDELGQQEVKDVTVPLDRNRVTLEFAGLSFAAGDVLSFRYRLAERDSEWRPLAGQQSLDLVDIRPGMYRIELQAVNSDGVPSPQPAAVSLTILAPLWQRWWFITLVVLAVGGVVFSVVRMKVRRRLEMERIRTRIATDLHDDIGSSLTQMSILSEVAVRKLPEEPETAIEFMSQVTATSRTLVDAMSDIVWAINPARDRFSDLVHRMRRFANDLFAEGGIRFRFLAPEEGRDLSLGDDVRRHVYLVFKECLHNVIRHSGATEAGVELRIRSGCLEMEIRDDGRGFDPAAAADRGHGLQSMTKRASAVGGRLTIESRHGEGTCILLRVPVSSSLRAR